MARWLYLGTKRYWSPPVTARSRAVDAKRTVARVVANSAFVTAPPDFLSFEDLVEVAAVAAARKAGVSLQNSPGTGIRTDGTRHRAAAPSQRLVTDGRELFLKDSTTAPNLTALNRFGQVALSRDRGGIAAGRLPRLSSCPMVATSRPSGIVVDPDQLRATRDCNARRADSNARRPICRRRPRGHC